MRDERIVRLERNKDRAVATLLHQVEAVVEELPKEREPGVKRRRQALVRCRVGIVRVWPAGIGHAIEVQEGAIEVQDPQPGVDKGLHRCRVGDSLIDDQVGDEARVRIGHVGGAGVVRIGKLPGATKSVAVLVIAELLLQ